jgi:hypothetical protein
MAAVSFRREVRVWVVGSLKKQQRGGLQGFGFRSLRPLVDGWLLKQLRDLSFISPTRFSYCFSNNSRIFPNIIIWYFMSGQSIELAFPCCKLSYLCHPTTGHQYMPHATCHPPTFPVSRVAYHPVPVWQPYHVPKIWSSTRANPLFRHI